MGQQTHLIQTRLEQHTKIFASMCPDEILDHYDNYQTRMYYTTLMLGDISGISAVKFRIRKICETAGTDE